MKALEKLVTKRLYLVPLKLELLKAAIISIDELTTILGVKVAAEWADQEFIQAFPDIANILLQFPLQNEWGWGSLIREHPNYVMSINAQKGKKAFVVTILVPITQFREPLKIYELPKRLAI